MIAAEKVYHSVLRPKMLLGAPEKFTKLNIIVGAVLFSQKLVVLCILSIPVQFLGAYLASKDEYFLEMYKQHMHLKDKYEA